MAVLRPGFAGQPDGSVVARLPGWLRRLLTEQFAELDALLAAHEPAVAADDPLALLTGLTGGSGEAPTDPVLARLRPDGYRPEADPGGEQARDFRRFTETDLAGLQRARLATAREAVGGADRFVLDPDAAQALLGALNDLRLALGTRLEVREDDPPRPPRGDPRRAAHEVYALLGGLQHELLVALGAPREL